MQTSDFDIGELLDEANTILFSAPLDAERAALLIVKLRICAKHSIAGNGEENMREVADKLERRLLSC